MYEAFFGFRERPFQLTPNPRFLFLNPAHREALATLRYGLTSSLGITLLVGEAGTGKTTLLRAALGAERQPQRRHVLLCNPTLTPDDFYAILADGFSLTYATGQKGRFLIAFERDLRARHQAGGATAIIVDEAQSLSHALFEEIRLLANFETDTAKLVNVVLAGQPELEGRLEDPSLRQLRQRVVLRSRLAPLDLRSTADYIATRLRVAGAAPDAVFTREAVCAIFEASRGIPRTIGVVCENALIAGFGAQRKPVDAAAIVAVCRDFGLPTNGHGVPVRAEPETAIAAAAPVAARVQPLRGNGTRLDGNRVDSGGNATRVDANGSGADGTGTEAPPEERRSRRAIRSLFARPKPEEPSSPSRIFKFF